jgi:hypothetical protein
MSNYSGSCHFVRVRPSKDDEDVDDVAAKESEEIGERDLVRLEERKGGEKRREGRRGEERRREKVKNQIFFRLHIIPSPLISPPPPSPLISPPPSSPLISPHLPSSPLLPPLPFALTLCPV